jgi:hypothetical protein
MRSVIVNEIDPSLKQTSGLGSLMITFHPNADVVLRDPESQPSDHDF